MIRYTFQNMTNKTLKKYSLLKISLMILAASIALACAWIDMDDYPASYFAPETIHSSSYSPYFLSYHYFYYKSDGESFRYVDNNVKNFNQVNINEWNDFLGKSTSNDDIRYIL